MILLDTNVISELMRPAPHVAVLRWLDAQAAQDLTTTPLTVAEIGAGLADFYAPRRRAGRPVAGLDLLIASIAHAPGMVVATRNVSDYDGFGVVVVDPWQDGAPLPR